MELDKSPSSFSLVILVNFFYITPKDMSYPSEYLIPHIDDMMKREKKENLRKDRKQTKPYYAKLI